MSTEGDSTGTILPIRADGIDLARLAKHAATSPTSATDESHRFWSSNPRMVASTVREVMQVDFGAKRMINSLTFKVGRFPLVMEAEYLADDGSWQPLAYSRAVQQAPVRVIPMEPVRLVISESIPAQVDSARAANHPQHYGTGHWLDESWKVMPVETRSVRLVLTRNHQGHPPKNPQGQYVPYSLAVKDLQIGYRVSSLDDVPSVAQRSGEAWAASRDILGSPQVYATYEQPAANLVDGSDRTFWRSEPQPFPFAVVNVVLDLQDSTGEVPVVDRFWMDPVTVGPVCNLYYSNAEVTGSFDGSSEDVPFEFRTEVGNPGLLSDGATGALYQINLGGTEPSGVGVAKMLHRLDYERSWWVGLDAVALGTLTGKHNLVTLGAVQVLFDDTQVQVLAQSGEKAALDLDPAMHSTGARYRLVAAYVAPGDTDRGVGYFRLTYQMDGFEPVTTEIKVGASLASSGPIKFGLHPDPDSTTVADLGVRGLVVKSEAITEDTESWFLDEGQGYVADAPSPRLDRKTSRNARLRMHPEFSSPDNPFGVVGGTANEFDDLEWTPVTRDYTLKRGYMHLPPTRARYWKFEMTRLLPEVYENFVTIDRAVQVFPPDVLSLYEAVAGGKTSASTPSGVQTTANVFSRTLDPGALESVARPSVAEDATTVLVVKNPEQAAQAAKTGWIWGYQDWHVGTTAPQFTGTRVHRYENLKVRHATKVAYFAAIREITPYRVDYTFNDDTPEYVEHLLDDRFLSTVTGMNQYEGGLTATSNFGEAVSEGFASYRNVRGVQFATKETDSIQVLEDPDFVSANFEKRWHPYGDATLTRRGRNDVVVNRGWFAYTYKYLEENFPTYGDLEGVLYGALEGNDPTSGYAEGGFSSEPYTPSGAGRIMAKVQASTVDRMSAPVIVEIVDRDSGLVVASGQQWLQSGETADIEVGYAPGTIEQRSGGTVHRRTWGEVENYAYYVAAPASNAVTPSGDGTVIGSGAVWNDNDDSSFATATLTGGLFHSMTTYLAPVEVGDSVDVVTMRVRAKIAHPDNAAFMAVIRNPNTNAPVASLLFVEAPGEASDLHLTLNTYDPVALATALSSGAKVEFSLNNSAKYNNTANNTLTVYQIDVQAYGSPGATYGSLDGILYRDIETWTEAEIVTPINGSLFVRVRQQGTFRDSFSISSVRLYDSPIAWFFSNDDGLHWWQAIDVRNDPHGVLIFPEALPEDEGNDGVGTILRWKAQTYREGATINAIHIRPWYGNRARTVEGAHGLDALGPNYSIYDNFPATHDHPMWQAIFNPIENDFVEVETEPFWRNLVPQPGGEGSNQENQTYEAQEGEVAFTEWSVPSAAPILKVTEIDWTPLFEGTGYDDYDEPHIAQEASAPIGIDQVITFGTPLEISTLRPDGIAAIQRLTDHNEDGSNYLRWQQLDTNRTIQVQGGNSKNLMAYVVSIEGGEPHLTAQGQPWGDGTAVRLAAQPPGTNVSTYYWVDSTPPTWLSSPTQGWAVGWVDDNQVYKMYLVSFTLDDAEITPGTAISISGDNEWSPGFAAFDLGDGVFFASSSSSLNERVGQWNPSYTRLRAYQYDGTLLDVSDPLFNFSLDASGQYGDDGRVESIVQAHDGSVLCAVQQNTSHEDPNSTYAWDIETTLSLRQCHFDGTSWVLGAPVVLSYTHSDTRASVRNLQKIPGGYLVDMAVPTNTPGYESGKQWHFERRLLLLDKALNVLNEVVIDDEDYSHNNQFMVMADGHFGLVGWTQYDDQGNNQHQRLFLVQYAEVPQ